MDTRVRIHNSSNYAEDLNLVSSSAAGFPRPSEHMLAVCADMLNEVQHNKSNIVCIAKQPHIISLLWALRDFTFNSQSSSVDHINRTKNVDTVYSCHSKTLTLMCMHFFLILGIIKNTSK